MNTFLNNVMKPEPKGKLTIYCPMKRRCVDRPARLQISHGKTNLKNPTQIYETTNFECEIMFLKSSKTNKKKIK